MTLKFFDSPFHVTHDDTVASKMAMKTDLAIILDNFIKSKDWSQREADELLEDRETYYLVIQLKLAREALERRLTLLEEEYSEGLD